MSAYVLLRLIGLAFICPFLVLCCVVLVILLNFRLRISLALFSRTFWVPFRSLSSFHCFRLSHPLPLFPHLFVFLLFPTPFSSSFVCSSPIHFSLRFTLLSLRFMFTFLSDPISSSQISFPLPLRFLLLFLPGSLYSFSQIHFTLSDSCSSFSQILFSSSTFSSARSSSASFHFHLFPFCPFPSPSFTFLSRIYFYMLINQSSWTGNHVGNIG